MRLDSRQPTLPVALFEATETRFSALDQLRPDDARNLRELEQQDIDERWRLYEEMAGRSPGSGEVAPDPR
jgi:pyruvate-ferredoxin/flavodoxin oxidoreductase